MFNSSLNELFKLPVLYAHFMEHRNLDKNIDLMDFLSMHYCGNDLNDNDQDRDMQLPFKQLDDNISFQLALIPITKLEIKRRQVSAVQKLLLLTAQNFNLDDPSINCLFRPPIA